MPYTVIRFLSMEEVKETTKIEIKIDDLGFSTETVDARAVVLSGILDELGINNRRYYTRRTRKGCKYANKPDIEWADLTIVFVVLSDTEHVEFVKYLYQQRMELVVKCRKMMS